MNTNSKVERERELRNEACKYEMQGNHEKAMECFKEICEMHKNYGHMVLLANNYAKGGKTESGQFPQDAEHQLECLLLAVDKAPDYIMAPIFAWSLAKRLDKAEVVDAMEKVAQERGVWEYMLFNYIHESKRHSLACRIASYYREGFGCAKNEEIAGWYDRIADGELQAVLKDMLFAEYDRLLKLMNSKHFYQLRSLSELDGVSEEFKTKFLYGSDDELNMPEWFVPMVNELNVYDRNELLSQAYKILEQRYTDFLGKVHSGKYEVVERHDYCEWDLFLISIDGRLKAVSIDDFESLVHSDKAEELQQLQKRFKDKINSYRKCDN